MAITASQCRAARALVDMSQGKLAERAKVSLRTVQYFESEERQPIDVSMDAIQGALEKVGVEFIPENGGGPGVRMKKRASKRE